MSRDSWSNTIREAGVTEWEGFNTENYLQLLKHIEDRMVAYPEDGGTEEKTAFFSAMDESYRQVWIVDALLDRLYHKRVVLSGGFGELVVQRIEERNLRIDYLLYNGGLRSGEKPELLSSHSYGRNIWDEGYVCLMPWWLVDDSYYSGRTLLVLKKAILELGESNKITNTVVIYDGSNGWNPHIHALYKWYMIHGLELIE